MAKQACCKKCQREKEKQKSLAKRVINNVECCSKQKQKTTRDS